MGPVWGKVRQICKSVEDNTYTLVRAANGVSKTWTATGLALWWLKAFGPTAKVITTANTWNQTKFVLWTRLRENYRKVSDVFYHVPIHITQFFPDRDNYPDWFAVGLNPDVHGDEAPAFGGHHTPTGRVLFIFEEAIGIPAAVFKAADGSLRSDNARLLAIFNPLYPEGAVYDLERDGTCTMEKGNLIEISAFDLFNDPDYEKTLSKIKGLATPAGVKEKIDKLGENDPWVQSRIFAQYPEQHERAIVSVKGIEQAKSQQEAEQRIGRIRRVVYSWDVAGEGTDENVLDEFLVGHTEEVLDDDGEVVWDEEKGLGHRVVDAWHDEPQASMERVQEILDAAKKKFWTKPKDAPDDWEKPSIELVVDALGEGSHVPSIMRNWNRGEDGLCDITITGFKSSGKASPIPGVEEEFLNRISEAWYITKLIVNEGRWWPLVADLDSQTRHELTTRKSDHKRKGGEMNKWFVEPKEEYKARNRGRSPDRADAFVMGLWQLRHKPRTFHALR